MKKNLFITVCLEVLLLLFGTFDAKACSCMITTTCQAYSRAELVFVGRIIKATKTDGSQKHQVQVEENFLGVENIPLVDVYTDQATSCAFEMDEGKKYLIFARRDKETGAVWTGMCSKTSEIEGAKDDLEYLRAVNNSAKTGGTVKGEVLDENSTDEEPKKPEQVDKVFIESEDGEKFEAAIEPDGKYEIGGLKKGKYKIYITPPKGYTTNYDANPYAADELINPQFTDVPGQGCVVKNFEVKINGVISGKVFDANGLPVKERRVNLFRLLDPDKIKNQTETNSQIPNSADNSDETDGEETTQAVIKQPREEEFEEDYDYYTDEDGSFSFRGLPPGRYLLGFEIDHYLSINAEDDQYVPTFFPGTKKKETAVIIELKKSQILTDRNIQLFPKLKKRKISGQIIWKNGKVEPKAKVEYYAKREGNPDSDWLGWLKINAKGNFEFDGFEKTEYLIKARLEKPVTKDSSEITHSSKCFIIPKNGAVEPVKIVLEIGGGNCDEAEF